MRQIILGLLLSAFFADAQYDQTVDEFYYFEGNHSFSLSGAAAALTVRVPANTERNIVLQQAIACSTVDTRITLQKGGTATAGTTVTTTALNTPQTTSVQLVHGATLGSGVQVGLPISVQANACSPTIDLTKIKFVKDTASIQVFNLVSDTETGTVTVSITYAETRR